MIASSPTSPGHSADVRMELHINGHVLPIAQLGPDFLVLNSPVDHPPTEAEIAMFIDGRESRWPIHLFDGVSAMTRRTRIARRLQVNGSTVE